MYAVPSLSYVTYRMRYLHALVQTASFARRRDAGAGQTTSV